MFGIQVSWTWQRLGLVMATTALAVTFVGCEVGGMVISEDVQPDKDEGFVNADNQGNKKVGMAPGSDVGNDNTDVSGLCTLCFTCGGSWPNLGGVIPVSGDPMERGSGCSGGLEYRSDSRPYLCCY